MVENYCYNGIPFPSLQSDVIVIPLFKEASITGETVRPTSVVTNTDHKDIIDFIKRFAVFIYSAHSPMLRLTENFTSSDQLLVSFTTAIRPGMVTMLVGIVIIVDVYRGSGGDV